MTHGVPLTPGEIPCYHGNQPITMVTAVRGVIVIRGQGVVTPDTGRSTDRYLHTCSPLRGLTVNTRQQGVN